MPLDHYIRCKRTRPCPVCGKPDWCLVSNDGKRALCARVPSGRQCGIKGAGWIHRLDEPLAQVAPAPKLRSRPVRDFGRLAWSFKKAVDLTQAAAGLGVSPEALERMGTGRCKDRLTFPMKDHERNIIGIRTRNPEGRKKSLFGSRNGLFIPIDYQHNGEAWVCEGPTDCAALLTVGIEAVGRPSNTGGLDHLIRFLDGVRTVIVLADRDSRPEVDEITMRGARELAQRVGRIAKIVRPPHHKDVRDWVRLDGKDAAAALRNMAENKESVK